MRRSPSHPRQQKIDGWYRVSTYAHFDNPLSYEKALDYVSNPERVAHHAFRPFLTFEVKQRHFSVMARAEAPQPTTKVRTFATPSHLDGHVFSWYARILSQSYEAMIPPLGLGDSILAYRPGGTTVANMAEQAFAEIASRSACLVVALDVEKFVPSIGHAHLKEEWARVIGQKGLPSDHFAVFKAVTRYAGVDRLACLSALNIDLKGGQLPHPLCSGPRFRSLIRDAGLVKVNVSPYGLPQGCQLSAILSNIALFRFDEAMLEAVRAFGGSYRRYCDDILLILNSDTQPEKIVDRVQSKLAEISTSLKLNAGKTEIVVFARDVDGCLRSSSQNGVQYLGFTFDGQRVLIRSRTIAKFVRGFKYAVKQAETKASATGQKVYRRSILRRFSPLGTNNFLSRHVKPSQKVMPGDHIRRQFRRQIGRVLRPAPRTRQPKPSPGSTW